MELNRSRYAKRLIDSIGIGSPTGCGYYADVSNNSTNDIDFVEDDLFAFLYGLILVMQ